MRNVDAGERKELRGRSEITKQMEKSISGLYLKTDVRDWHQQPGEWIVDTVMSEASRRPQRGSSISSP